MAARVATAGGRLDSDAPHELFDTGIQTLVGRDQYAVTPDGQRFLLLKPIDSNSRDALTVIVNWPRLVTP